MRGMKRRLGLIGLLACAVTGCGASASAPPAARPLPHPSASPAIKPSTSPSVNPRVVARPKRTPDPAPLALYSQEHVGKGKYQLINTLTYQFVEVSADGLRTVCRSGANCTDDIKIGVTEYSGNTQVLVSPGQFALVSMGGVRYDPATARQAAGVVQSNDLLSRTMLQPDDDGDFTSGTLVFLVPKGAGRFSLLWQGDHVATFVKTAQGRLYETR